LERTRVLLVDDMPEMIEYYAEILNADSYDIVGVASNAVIAFGMVAEMAPQVILLDISMPGMNGIELARRLRAARCLAAIIFVSSDDALATEAMDAGGSAFVSKNLIAPKLRVAIREALAGRSFVSVWPESKP
jgi:DNA-binding NarL/FixJ family response regulator